MDITPLLLSRLQVAFTVSFHIIFPSFTIGLAAWLTALEALYFWTGRPAYRRTFAFWLKIFGVAFGLGVVSEIVMAFEFGTNWSELSRASEPIQGPLLTYETFTAFFLEASFFGILLFGRTRVAPSFYLFSTAMVALGTTLSAFWIMVNNSWMQVPVGYEVQNGVFIPVDWAKVLFSPVVWVRFPHLLLASYLTGAFCVAATGAWYLLRREFTAEAQIMLRMGLYFAAVLLPLQLFFGHLPVMARWVERPLLFVFPAAGAMATVLLARSVERRRDGVPFLIVTLIFVAAFGTLAIPFWPYVIPFSITIDAAAAPHASLAFMFWGAGLFVFPLMLVYTAVSYFVFRGKAGSASHGY